MKTAMFIFLCLRGFVPVAVNFLRRVPVIGTILCLPGISSVSCYINFIRCVILFAEVVILLVLTILTSV